jgi:hypothetical protein
LKFTGIREYPANLMPLQIGNCFAGFFLRSHNQINELSWTGTYPGITGWVHPAREQLEAFRRALEESYNTVDCDGMAELFEGWPRNSIEEWATDYNYSFHLRYNVFYDAQTLESIVAINGFGIHSLNWTEYQESYHQAHLMHKLKENL